MSQHQGKLTRQSSQRRVLIDYVLASCASVLGLMLITACGTTLGSSAPQASTQVVAAVAVASTTAGATVTSQVTPQATNTVPPIATMLRTAIPGTPAPTRVYFVATPEYEPTLAPGDSKSAFDTRVAENHAALGTALALTPSSTPGSPTATYTPAPIATQIIGWFDCGGSANSHVDQYGGSCWQLTVNGHLYNVRAGRHGDGDLDQGVINIREVAPDGSYSDVGTYETPSKQGGVEIASIYGTRVYLVQSTAPVPFGAAVTPIPNFVFVFDLATLQWVSP